MTDDDVGKVWPFKDPLDGIEPGVTQPLDPQQSSTDGDLEAMGAGIRTDPKLEIDRIRDHGLERRLNPAAQL